MTTTPLWVALGALLMMAGSADASRTDDANVQAPRAGRQLVDFSGMGEAVQAPRGQNLQAPGRHGVQDARTPLDENVQAPRGASK
jgi:hypothetical protein